LFCLEGAGEIWIPDLPVVMIRLLDHACPVSCRFYLIFPPAITSLDTDVGILCQNGSVGLVQNRVHAGRDLNFMLEFERLAAPEVETCGEQ
jgi:hypothetical protein